MTTPESELPRSKEPAPEDDARLTLELVKAILQMTSEQKRRLYNLIK